MTRHKKNNSKRERKEPQNSISLLSISSQTKQKMR